MSSLFPNDPSAGQPHGQNGLPMPSGPVVKPPPPPVISAPPSGLALLKALRRRWKVAAILCPLFAVAIVAAIWKFMPPSKYTAVSKLLIRPTNPNPILRASPGEAQNLDNFRQLQMTLIRNQRVLAAAMRDPKINQLPTIKYSSNPIQMMEDSLTFSSPGNAEVLEVKFQGFIAEDSQQILDSIIKSYLTEFINGEQNIRNMRMEELRMLKDKYDGELRQNQAALEQLQAKGSGNANVAALQMAFLRTDVERIKSTVSALEKEIVTLDSRATVLKTRDPSRLPMGDKLFQEFFAQDSELISLDEERRVASANVVNAQTEGFKPDFVAKLKEKVTRLEGQIRDRQQELRPQAEAYWRKYAAGEMDRDATLISNTLEFKREELKHHQKDLTRFQGMLEDLSKNQTRLNNFDLNTEATKAMFEKVKTELEYLKAEANTPPRVRELDEARVVPMDPLERKIKIAFLGGAVAILMVMAVLALWEFHSRRVESVDQIVYGLGLPLVGTVPAMPRHPLLGLTGRMSAEEVEQWRFALQESVATARTVLLNAARTQQMRVVMITSAMAGEGKTSISTQLAVSLAMAGYRTLLVDFDLRNPTAYKRLAMPNVPGCCEVLRGEVKLDDAVRPSTLNNLYFLAAGDADDDSRRALVQENLAQMIAALRTTYDFIIIDTSPVLPVVDALLMGRHVDGVIFSVLSEFSQLPKIYIATQRVAELGIRTIGAVVNGVKEDKYGYGNYGYGRKNIKRKPAGVNGDSGINNKPVTDKAAANVNRLGPNVGNG